MTVPVTDTPRGQAAVARFHFVNRSIRIKNVLLTDTVMYKSQESK